MGPLPGYAAELQRIEQDIAAIGGADALAGPGDPQRVTQYIYHLYQRASIAGDLPGLCAAERAIEHALPGLTHPGDLYLLKANIAFKLHRLADVEAALSAVPSVDRCNEGRLIRADLDFQHGRYKAAERSYLEALSAERSWSAVARLAYLRGKMGDVGGADRLYREAEDELTAKEMRSYAWLEVQRGFLAFSSGCYDRAQSHYDQAAAAYPGYWLVEEHIAELLGGKGRYSEAIEVAERMTATADRPDLQQALGELYELTGQPGRARYWQEKALAGYRQSVQRGEVHFFHHLADYYSDVTVNGAEAVLWARADLELRENFSTQAALAWALYRDGNFAEARVWIDRALRSGAVEGRLFFKAAKIYCGLGNQHDGRSFMEQAKRLNPDVENFHIHH